MGMALATRLSEQVQAAAAKAGLVVTDSADNAGFNGVPTEKYTLALQSAPQGHTTQLELGAGFDMAAGEYTAPVHEFLLEASKRLRNPRPDLYVTLGGMPISMGAWQWPFHLSTSGADTYIVHGEARLEDGATAAEAQLRAKVSASMTVTFAEVVPAPEQPFAEGLYLQRGPQDS